MIKKIKGMFVYVIGVLVALSLANHFKTQSSVILLISGYFICRLCDIVEK